MTFATALRELRNALSMSQSRLAEASGVSQMMISHYEAGRREPSLKNIHKLVQGLGCTYEELLR